MNHEYNAHNDPPSPELLAHIGDLTVVLTWDNTELHFYRPPWRALLHYQVEHMDLPYEGRVFGDPAIFNQCYALYFPFRWAMRPPGEVVDAFVQLQSDKLAGELDS